MHTSGLHQKQIFYAKLKLVYAATPMPSGFSLYDAEELRHDARSMQTWICIKVDRTKSK